MDAAPHMSCIGGTRASLREVLAQYRAHGIRHLVALRGDLPSGAGEPGDFRYASELVAFIRAGDGRLVPHRRRRLPRVPPAGAAAPQDDLAAFKRKIDAGAELGDHAVFLQSRRVLALRRRGARGRHRRADRAGHHADRQRVRARALFGRLRRRDSALDPPQARRLRRRHGVDPRVRPRRGDRPCAGLLARGAPGLHFYTLNVASLTTTIWQRLGI